MVVTDAWHPQINGVVRVLDALMPRLQAMNCSVELIHPAQFFTIRMPFYPQIELALFPRRRMRRLLQEANFDAIHIMTEGPLGWAARRECISKGITFTTWYHTRLDLYVNVWLRGLLGPMHTALRHFHERATRTFVSTSSLRQELESRGFKKMVLVPLGVDSTVFQRRESAHNDFSHPVFLYFSRLDPEKSPEDFLKLKLPGTKIVVGDGAERQRLEKKYGSQAHFLGFKHGEELTDLLSVADVMVFPSRTETFGLVILEALACNIPIAAYDVTGPRDIITQGVDGYIDDNLERAALACLSIDRSQCRKKALQYSWEHTARLFLQHLEPITLHTQYENKFHNPGLQRGAADRQVSPVDPERTVNNAV